MCADFPLIAHFAIRRAADFIESIAAELERVKRERDVAVECIKETKPCIACSNDSFCPDFTEIEGCEKCAKKE